MISFRLFRPIPFLSGLILLAGCAPEHEESGHWTYSGSTGPEHWADLDPAFASCGSGTEQSPIDISDTEAVELVPAERTYRPASIRIIRQEHVLDVVDNGHTIQINFDEGSVLTVGDTEFELRQTHFHAPSEHTINGRHSPMEMHLVHQSADGALAVVGVMIEEGEHNATFDPVWADLPDEVGEEVHLEHVQFDVDELMPDNQKTYRYRGSLTTPPCSEGVTWLVETEAITLSADQIQAFTRIINNNNRPVQALGDRLPVTDEVPES